MLKQYINDKNRLIYILEKKQNIINEYKSKFNTMQQRTKEWYNIRKTTIGGSEISTILGLNPFKSKKALIGEKIGLSKFVGNDATRWGTLFEDVTKQWTEKCLLMPKSITEIGNIEGINPRQRYSPDGIGVVKLNTEIELDNEIIETNDYFIVLFEFKSPFKSIPDQKVPKYYLPQVLTGLLNINITEIGIFVNNSYRKCPLSYINEKNYNKIINGKNIYYDNNYHNDNSDKIKKFNKVLGYGVLYFYQNKSDLFITNENKIDENFNENFNRDKILLKSYSFEYDDINYIKNINNLDELNNLIDFGYSYNSEMNELLKLYDSKRIKVIYLPLSLISENIIDEIEFLNLHNKKYDHKLYNIEEYKKIILEKIQKNIHNEYPIGYLPFKILKSDIIHVNKDNEWKNKITNPVNETLNTLDIILNDKNPIQKYNELFNIVNSNLNNLSNLDNLDNLDNLNNENNLSNLSNLSNENNLSNLNNLNNENNLNEKNLLDNELDLLENIMINLKL